MLRKIGAFFVFDVKSKLSLRVLTTPLDIVNIVIMLLASCTSFEVVLCTSFCLSQNTRRAICTRSLTSELVDSRRLIILLDRSEALGFVFFEDVNVDCRYVRQCRTRYICLAANSICFRSAQTRYEINPSFAKQTYRATAISSCVSNISKIPQGIYLDVLEETIKNAQHKLSIFCIRPKVEIISSRTEVHDEQP